MNNEEPLPDVDFPKDVEFRMIISHQQFITNEFNYYKTLLRQHENELFWLSLGLVSVIAFDYYIVWRMRRIERLTEGKEDA